MPAKKKPIPKQITLNEEQQAVVSDDSRKYCIYLIANLKNGKQYCGQTCTGLRVRWNRHRYEANSGNDTTLYRAIRKYGEFSFSIKTIEYDLTREQANQREIYWIKELDLRNKEKGYNITAGGESGPLFVAPMRPDLDAEELPRLYEEGLSILQLAEKFKASTATIWKKLHKQGVKVHSPGGQERSDLKNEEIKFLYEQGFSTLMIANKLQSCSSAITKRLKNLGICRRTPKDLRMKIDEVKATCMYLDGRTLKEIGKEVGMALSTVHKRLKQLGVIYDEENFDCL